MSTLKTDAITAATGTNTDLDLSGKGSGVPDIASGFKVGGTAGLPINNLRTGTDGELITWDASGDPATVAVGTATHVLTSNGAGAAPTFQAAAGGGASTLLSYQTGTSGSSFEFTSKIDDATYLGYLFDIIWVPSDDTYLKLEWSVDNGSSYLSSGCQSQNFWGRDSLLDDDSGADSHTTISPDTTNFPNAATGAQVTCKMINPEYASEPANIHFQGGFQDGANPENYSFWGFGSSAGAGDSSANFPVDAVKFSVAAGTFSYYKVAMYGFKIA